MRLAIVMCCLIVLGGCYRTMHTGSLAAKHIYFCEFDSTSGWWLCTSSCDTTIKLYYDNITVQMQLDDCSTGLIHFERRWNNALLEKGDFKSGKRKTKRTYIEDPTDPGVYIKAKARGYVTHKTGTWNYYDTLGVLTRTEKFP